MGRKVVACRPLARDAPELAGSLEGGVRYRLAPLQSFLISWWR